MSTQTFERVDSIEHLDHQPACDAIRHKGDRGPADYWFCSHDGDELFVCHACYMSWRDEWTSEIRAWGTVLCAVCHHCFTSVDDAHTVRRL